MLDIRLDAARCRTYENGPAYRMPATLPAELSRAGFSFLATTPKYDFEAGRSPPLTFAAGARG